MRFGISTHLYHDATLSREHLATIAAHEFEAIELFATRTHVDYHDAHAVAQLGGWLREKIQHRDGELSRHQRLEAAAWGVGAILGAAGFVAWVWFG